MFIHSTLQSRCYNTINTERSKTL